MGFVACNVTFNVQGFFSAVQFVSYLLNNPLVSVEIEVQFGVVLLDDDPGGLFDCLGANATHFRGFFVDGVEKFTRKTSR